jgi:propionyl-CoA synthetase
MPSQGRFAEVYAAAARDPERFWAEAAADIDWSKPWSRVLDRTRPLFFNESAGAEIYTCFNAVDRHVAAGRARCRADLRQPGHGRAQALHVRGAARGSRAARARCTRSGWLAATP